MSWEYDVSLMRQDTIGGAAFPIAHIVFETELGLPKSARKKCGESRDTFSDLCLDAVLVGFNCLMIDDQKSTTFICF